MYALPPPSKFLALGVLKVYSNFNVKHHCDNCMPLLSVLFQVGHFILHSYHALLGFHPPSPSLPPPKDEYKSYLPMWRQEMKDNKIIKCPNFEVKSVCCSNPYSLVPRPRGRRESPSLLPRSLGTRLQPLWHLTSVSF